MEAPGFYTTSPNKDQEMDERLFASTANLRRLAVDGTVCPEFGFGVAIQIRYFKVVTIYHLALARRPKSSVAKEEELTESLCLRIFGFASA